MGRAQVRLERLRLLRCDGHAAAARLRAPDLTRRRYTLDNIAPACRSCNASKCNDEVTGWLRRKRLDERAFLIRHVEIRTALAVRFDTHVAAIAADPADRAERDA